MSHGGGLDGGGALVEVHLGVGAGRNTTQLEVNYTAIRGQIYGN